MFDIEKKLTILRLSEMGKKKSLDRSRSFDSWPQAFISDGRWSER